MWVDLRILDKKLGGVSDDYGEVEFKAGYKLNQILVKFYISKAKYFKKVIIVGIVLDQKSIDSNN